MRPETRALIPLALALLAATLVGCAGSPDYRRPVIEVPAQFREAALFKLAGPAAQIPQAWWQLFGDEVLNGLQSEMSAGNENLRAALAQYRAASAALDASRAPLLPTVGTSVSASRGRSPTAPASSTIYTPAATASWEADLWGRLGAQVDSARARLEASEFDLAAVRLSLQATLAQTYLGMRAAEAQIALLDNTVKAYQRSLEMTQDRYRVGVVSATDVAQAQTQLKSAQAQAAEAQGSRALLEHAIAVLLGRPPASLVLAENSKLPDLPNPPTQVPAELLRRRPDIAAAERRVAAANAQVGLAQTAFFPSVTLSANANYRASGLADLISAPHLFWSLGPSLALTAFDGGARRAAVEGAQAALEQTAAAYRQTVLTAMQEVEDNLALAAALHRQTQLLEESLVEARRALELTLNQYRAGTVSYLNVVAAQTTALSVERALLDARSRQLSATNQLLKNLAGDWR